MRRCIVTRLFGALLAERVLSHPISFLEGPDIKVWRSSCTLKMVGKDLYNLYREESSRRLDGWWIWRFQVYPRVSLFI